MHETLTTMFFVGLLFIFCFGISMGQQDFGLCSQVYQMHEYCTNQDRPRVDGDRIKVHNRMGKAGPRGLPGPPGFVNYTEIYATTEKHFQDVFMDIRQSVAEIQSALLQKNEEMNELRSEIEDLKDKFENFKNREEPEHLINWYRAGKNYYMLFNDTVNYATAKSNCEAHGAKLASVGMRNGRTRKKLMDLIKDSGGDDTWIGLDDSIIEGTFIWSDGVAGDSIQWDNGQPNNHEGDQDCVETGAQWKFKMNDEDCMALGKYLCEIIYSP